MKDKERERERGRERRRETEKETETETETERQKHIDYTTHCYATVSLNLDHQPDLALDLVHLRPVRSVPGALAGRGEDDACE